MNLCEVEVQWPDCWCDRPPDQVIQACRDPCVVFLGLPPHASTMGTTFCQQKPAGEAAIPHPLPSLFPTTCRHVERAIC